jgi:hypothetical protein
MLLQFFELTLTMLEGYQVCIDMDQPIQVFIEHSIYKGGYNYTDFEQHSKSFRNNSIRKKTYFREGTSTPNALDTNILHPTCKHLLQNAQKSYL